LIDAHRRWGPGENSPGANLSLKELSRERGKVVYAMYSTGLPRDRVYDSVEWPVTLDAPRVNLPGVTFDSSGRAVCAGRPGTCGTPTTPDDPIDLTFFPVKGEPYRLAVVDHDDPSIRAFIKVVPTPLAQEDGGCRVEAVLLMPHAEILLIEASGYPPRAELSFESNSEGEIHNATPSADEAGRYTAAVMPAKAGLTRGVVKVRVVGPRCSPEVQVPWSAEK
jgi:hypothetical protein